MNVDVVTSAFRRYVHLLMRPEEEWNLIVAERPSLAEIVFPFTAMGIAVCFLSSLVGSLLRVEEHSLLVDIVTRPLADCGAVAAFAAVSGLVARRFGAIRPAMGEASALYSSIGIWMASVLGFIPVRALGWLWFLLGAAYAAFLYHRALDVAVGLPRHTRLKALLLSLGGLLVAGSVLRWIEQLVGG